MDDYVTERHLKLMRERLNAEKIKLWLTPYTLESGERGDVPKELISRYAKDLGLAETEVVELLESLRQHALQKLSERDKFQKEGIATLKMIITACQTEEGLRKHAYTTEIQLSADGSDLRKKVAHKCNLPIDQIKLITCGRVIKDNASLQEQSVKNGSKVMAVRLSVAEAEAHRQQKQASNVAKTREAAELLTTKIDSEEDDFDIQIADQSGKPLQLPLEEKKALTLAMTLHEKGRASLKKKEISQALLLFLEADTEFSKCKAELLHAVDNYAVLCLDIVWCYLCLKNVDQLPDAEWRLEQSEKCFLRSYGANNERLTAVKGGTGSEQAQALFMRLHLLQGVMAFHQHRVKVAAKLLGQAEEELKSLQVDENLITEVMSVGFKEKEARLALRACKGDVQKAVDHIINRRKEKKEMNMKLNQERKEKLRAKKFGKTASGEWLNMHNMDMLVGMGFASGAAAEALKQGNNDVNMALEILQTHPELLDIVDPEDEEWEDVHVTDDMLAQLTALGYELEMGRRSLMKHKGNVEKAVDDLIRSGGFIPPNAPMPGSSRDRDNSNERKEEMEALDSLMSDISRDEDDYLDLTLKEESEILCEYRTMLASLDVS
ncbi:NEDD8 ultimate buster 1-like [Haliotis rufescens]|uniref:NEDD8 ultimate buster 1-like n=1 Tax=Haliotis rufescens TaxID=6454 RepID=UPI00201FA1AF|nr:NEDD8 ultimate buster 1-like [Haliotis rufescens]